jgi:hypothetical protein
MKLIKKENQFPTNLILKDKIKKSIKKICQSKVNKKQ